MKEKLYKNPFKILDKKKILEAKIVIEIKNAVIRKTSPDTLNKKN